MDELERALVADSAAASPSHILDELSEDMADRVVPGANHTIYAEVWHVTFWQQITLDWVHGKETPVPVHAAGGFPGEAERAAETWEQLCVRFFAGARRSCGGCTGYGQVRRANSVSVASRQARAGDVGARPAHQPRGA